MELTDEETGELFSSPIGAFIFLIKAINECFERLWKQFSSPIGAFIFLIRVFEVKNEESLPFSSPIGAFIFLILLRK